MKSVITFVLGPILILLLLCSIKSQAQQPGADPVLKRGEELYAQSCAGFCHGAGGEAGGAPRLANRSFDGQYIERVITYGVPGTAMPAWGQRLIKEELTPVIAYVKSLNGIVSSSTNPRTLPLEASVGRDLFVDPTYELGACSNCHSYEGKGMAVVPINYVPVNVPGLRNLAGRNGSPTALRTATVGGETFTAWVATELKDEIRLYDMTTMPFSLRTFPRSAVTLKDGGSRQHNSVLGKYTDQELSSILTYFREMARPQ